jgi:hypothetical protein
MIEGRYKAPLRLGPILRIQPSRALLGSRVSGMPRLKSIYVYYIMDTGDHSRDGSGCIIERFAVAVAI